MTKEEIKSLAEKILLGTATEEDLILYNRICAIAEKNEQGHLQLSASEKLHWEQALKKTILKKIDVGKASRLLWLRWTIAAVFIILLGSTLYVVLKSSGKTKPNYALQSQEQRFQNEVLPGRQGAILTLGNGQQMVLDSASSGTLVSEGGAQVIKKQSGIVYDAYEHSGKVAYNTMSTPFGRQYQLTLADGTKVWLNAGSSITYPTVFTGRQRTVSITGEVYFEVARNRSMPFIVEKENVKVEVLGTHFNMNTYDDESSLKVTLLEGAVRVIKNGKENIIRPGQQARVTKEGITVADAINTEEVMAWKNGRFLFAGSTIDQLMRQLSRWYDVEIEYTSNIAILFYAEIPRHTNLSDVLKALELTGKVHFVINGKKIIVMP